MHKHLKLFFTAPVICLGLFFSLPTAFAATHTWVGGSALGPNWSVSTNWTGGVPGPGDDLVFPASAKNDKTNVNNINGSPAFNSISFTGQFTSESSYKISGNAITLAHGISDTATGGSQVLNLDKIQFANANAQTFLITNNNEGLTIGAIDLNGANLVLDGIGNMTIIGNITGSGMLTKSGTGTLILASDTNSYTGSTIITGGTLTINSNQTSSAISMTNANTLAGVGKTGNINIDSVGTISPGINAPGILTTGNLTFSSGSSFNIDLNGTTAGTGHDQIASNGNVTLNSSSLNATLGFTPTTGSFFTIITATGTISGTFKGLPNGATLMLGSRELKIAYTSNKVTLTDVTGQMPSATPTTPPTPVTTPVSNPTNPTPPDTTADSTPATTPTVIPGTECAGFTDVSNKDSSCDAITYMKSIGAMTGNPDGTFTPNSNMQRDQIAKLVLKTFKRFDGLADYCNDVKPFPDVSPGDWSYQYICDGKRLGMITGYLGDVDKGNYRPSRPVNRAELLALILRNLNEPMPDINSNSYLDVEPGEWYSGYAKFAFYQVLFMGQYLHPYQPATRAEGANIIYKLHQQGKL